MAGLTEKGFEAKRLDEIKTQLEAEISEAVGQVDFSADTPDGQVSGILSGAQARVWELAERIYQSQYPSTASGVSLDRVVDLNGIQRLDASPTTSSDVVVFGDVGTVLTAGRQASNSQTGQLYRLVQNVTLNTVAAVRARIEVADVQDGALYRITIGSVDYEITSGTGATADSILTALQASIPLTITTTLEDESLLIQLDNPTSGGVSANLLVAEVGVLSLWEAVEPGQTLLPAGTLTEIETPVAGWEGLINRTDGIPGRERETDAELRARRERSIGISAENTLDAIFANLAALDGVSGVTVERNAGTVVDANGIPPQHIWAIVSGGTDSAIADILYSKTAAGIGWKGDTVVTKRSDVTGVDYEIRFDRPDSIDVFISIDITVDTEIFPNKGESDIEQALEAFGANLRAGDTLLYSRLFSPINSVPGHFVTDLRLDVVDPPVAQGNIAAALNERISISAERITINVTS